MEQLFVRQPPIAQEQFCLAEFGACFTGREFLGGSQLTESSKVAEWHFWWCLTHGCASSLLFHCTPVKNPHWPLSFPATL